MKYYFGTSVFHFSWDQVAAGFWHRYPNPYSNHVLTEDVIFRKVTDDHKLVSKRLLTKTNHVPKWGERFISAKHVNIVEETIVDPIKKTLITYTRNIGLTRVMMVVEKCVYKQSEENPLWTICEKEAWVSSNFFGFAMAIQAFGIERFKMNAIKARKGFELILEKLYLPEPIPVDHHLLVFDKTKLIEKAKKARELAESKASPVMVKYSSNKQTLP